VSEVYQASETTQPASEAPATAPPDTSSGPASADNPGSYPEAALGDDFAGYSDADIDAILAAEEQLPEPRTRQEAAVATWDGGPDDPAGSEPTSEYDGDAAALLAEEQQLPEPRTRQEAAAATWDDTSSSQDTAPDASTYGTSPTQPDASMESSPRHDEGEDGAPDSYERQVAVHTTDRTDVQVTVEHLPPEARTVGDTTPTGIGRRPTGEEFLDMESDDLAGSGLDSFLGKMTEDAVDLHDAFGSVTETVHDLRLPGPVPGSGHAYEGQPVHEPMPPGEPGFSDLVGSAALVGVATLTAFRYWIWNRREGDRQ
jgi:hypothetical protein